MPVLTYTNVERTPYTPVTGPAIAKNVPDKYFVSLADSGLRMSMISSLPFSGWLLKFPLLVLPFAGQGICTLSYERRDDDRAAMYAQAVETDLMGIMPDSRVANWSGEHNIPNGTWEIAKKPDQGTVYQWKSAAKVQPVPPDTWVPHQFKYAWDFDKGVSSVIGGAIGDQLFTVDPSQQNIPLADLKWAGTKLVIQLQQTGNANPGAWSVEFRGVAVTIEYQ